MKTWTLWVAAFLGLWLAGGCEMALAARMTILGATPDFFIILTGSLGLFMSRKGSTWLGFASGLVMGGVSGANMAAYAVTRTLLGFGAGWAAGSEVESSPIMAMAVTASLTLVGGVLMLLVAPSGGILASLAATIGCAVYNGVLAMPFYALLKRILNPSD